LSLSSTSRWGEEHLGDRHQLDERDMAPPIRLRRDINIGSFIDRSHGEEERNLQEPSALNAKH
jgi:hypothetical protein